MIQSRVLIKKKHLLHQPTRVPLKASPAQEADVGWRRCMTNWCCLLERPAWPRPNATTRRDRQTERETENRWGHQVRAVTYPNLWILDSHWPVHPFWPEHQSSLWLQMSHLEIKEKQEQKRLSRETLQSAVEEVLRSIYLRKSSSFSLLYRMFLDVFSAGVEAWTHFVTTLNSGSG